MDDTDLIHGHEYFDKVTGAFIPPIFLSSIFEQRGTAKKSDRGVDLKYSREENPTVIALERVLSKLEGSEDTLCFNSGMASISSIYLHGLRAGNNIIITSEAYGTSIKLAEDLVKFGVHVKKAYPSADDIISKIDRETVMVFIEVMTNPTLKVIDINQVSEKTGKSGIKLIVDNTFLSPYNFKPIKNGADLSLESLTKYLSGHNDLIGGSVSGNRKIILDIWEWRRMLGTILNPFSAYMALRGVKTLGIRMERHQANALKVAKYLASSSKITDVMYPGLPNNSYYSIAKRMFRGFGGVVSFRVKGGRNEAISVLKSLKLIKPSPSLGGTESIMTYPVLSASSSINKSDREKLGITDSLLRLSVGLEDVEDIISDLENSLSKI
ncbi:MAG: cystathionine gamma-synthase family protein [Conexivisphaerales archaeon]